MAIVVNNVAKVTLMQIFVSTFNTYVLRLFVNNHTATETDTVTNFTEATFPGYAAKNLTSWGSAFLNSNTQGETDETVRVFTQTSVPGSPQTVYGYYITDGSGNLIWAENNPAGGQLLNAAPQTYTVLPRFMDDDL